MRCARLAARRNVAQRSLAAKAFSHPVISPRLLRGTGAYSTSISSLKAKYRRLTLWCAALVGVSVPFDVSYNPPKNGAPMD
jgi:hypothetical protein